MAFPHLSAADLASLAEVATRTVRSRPHGPSPMAEGPVIAAVFAVLVEQHRELLLAAEDAA